MCTMTCRYSVWCTSHSTEQGTGDTLASRIQDFQRKVSGYKTVNFDYLASCFISCSSPSHISICIHLLYRVLPLAVLSAAKNKQKKRDIYSGAELPQASAGHTISSSFLERENLELLHISPVECKSFISKSLVLTKKRQALIPQIAIHPGATLQYNTTGWVT